METISNSLLGQFNGTIHINNTLPCYMLKEDLFEKQTKDHHPEDDQPEEAHEGDGMERMPDW